MVSMSQGDTVFETLLVPTRRGPCFYRLVWHICFYAVSCLAM